MSMLKLEKQRAYMCKWYINNPDYMRAYQAKNRDKLTAYYHNWYVKNRNKMLAYNRKWIKNNPNKALAYSRKWRQANINAQLANSLRVRLWRGVLAQTTSKKGHFKDLVGISISELKLHLEKQFQPGMSWDNYGYYGWHVDHIQPVASFDLTKASEQRKAFNYKNLQPLWALDNMRKNNKLIYILK